MDLYTFLLFLGAAGLATMALRGFGGGHAGHGHAGHGHTGGHGHAGHANTGAHGHASHAGHAHGSSTAHGAGGGHNIVMGGLLHFASPRVLFSICLGAGALAPLLRLGLGGGAWLFAGAIGSGIIFERVVVNPIWNFAFRFAS